MPTRAGVWGEYFARRRRYFRSVALFVPLFWAFCGLLDHSHRAAVPVGILAVAACAYSVRAYLRFQRWPCPACGRRFNQFRRRWPLSRCARCGLHIGDGPPAEAADRGR